MVSLSIYSKFLLGSLRDPGMLSKKVTMLSRLGLFNLSDRSVDLEDIPSVILVFRISNFSDADLQICCDMDLTQLMAYSNPCNLRFALKAAISAFQFLGLDDSLLAMELECRFRPSEAINSSLEPCSPDFYPSLSSLSKQLVVCSGKHGHTLVASCEISRGDPIIQLGLDQGLSILTSFRDSRFPGKDLVEQGLHPDIVFLLYLIYLREKSLSRPLEVPDLWRDFFRCQPSNYQTLYEVSDECLEALNDPELTKTVRDQNEELMKICQSLSPPPSFADLLWAKSLCTSRAFSLSIPTNDDFENNLITSFYPSKLLTTLLPVVHFLNHDFQGQCETPIIQNDQIVVKALVSVSKNEQLFLIYGGMNNKELLLNYGFFVPGNPYDTIIRTDAVSYTHLTLPTKRIV